MKQVELNSLQDAFKNALLYQKKARISSLRQDMEKVLPADDLNKFLKNAKKWKKQCFALGEKTVVLAKNGKNRDSLEFDELPTLSERLNIMRNHVKCKYPPLELAAFVLPFNFR